MRIPRFYIGTELDLNSGQILQLSTEQLHYALNVLRLKDQRLLEVFDGKGFQAMARLRVHTRRNADIMVEKIEKPERESPLKLCLLQCISKGDRMDYTIQKSTELGISSIRPLISEFCDVKLDQKKQIKKLNHWRHIAIDACEQSGRNVLPQIMEPLKIKDWFDRQSESIKGWVLDPNSKTNFKSSIEDLSINTNKAPHYVLVGPEGGLSPTEVLKATSVGLNAIKLGPRILRTETAGVCMLSILQAYLGDF